MNDLLTLLSENARLTAAQLAVMLNKTEAEVAAAVKSYEESGVIKGYKAVSYTHLDVYKRQILRSILAIKTDNPS